MRLRTLRLFSFGGYGLALVAFGAYDSYPLEFACNKSQITKEILLEQQSIEWQTCLEESRAGIRRGLCVQSPSRNEKSRGLGAKRRKGIPSSNKSVGQPRLLRNLA